MHIQRKHPLMENRLSGSLASKKRKREVDSHKHPSILKAMKLDSGCRLSKEALDVAVLDLLITENLPFNLLDSGNFQKIVRKLTGQSHVKLMSRRTANDMFENKMRQLKGDIISQLERADYVCVTADCWSAHHRSFLGVTCHYMTENYERQSFALACRRVKGAHTFDVIGMELQSILCDFKIQNKVHRIVTDNGSNFVKAFRMFGQLIEACTQEEEEEECEDQPTSVDFFDEEPLLPSIVLSPEFVQVMEPLARCLDFLQGEKCVGLVSFLPQLENLKARLEMQRDKAEICRPLAEAVLQGISNRFSQCYGDRECLLATVSDPRRKLTWTKDVALREKARSVFVTKCDKFKPATPPVKEGQSDGDFLVFCNTEEAPEVSGYLYEPATSTLSVLDNYPRGKALFLRSNTTFPSSAAVERLFSCAGLVLTKNRSRLTDENFEAKVLLKFNREL